LRAVVFDGKLRFDPKRPKPKPKKGECLVKVRLAGICSTDLEIARGYLTFKGVVGHEFVGTVVDGPEALLDKRVACEINCVCRKCDMCLAGLAHHCRNRTVLGIAGRDGCFADYIAVPEHNLCVVPDNLPDEQAVFIEPVAAAYQVLAQCPVDERMNVSVVGPGRLGLLVAQVLSTTGCKLTVIGNNPKKLELCEKKHIQTIHIDELAPKQDRDFVAECTGSPEGLSLAMELVRPRGTIILKSTYADEGPLNLAPIVINEITLLGSRCGSFGEAINALARQAIDVQSMITRTFPVDKALEAFEVAQDPKSIKILLKFE